MKESISNFFNKNYKKILILPILILVLCGVYLAFFYSQTGDIIYKDVSLTGGTTITFATNITVEELEQGLSAEFPNIAISSISGSSGVQSSLLVTVPEPPEKIQPALEAFLGFSLTEENSSVEFTGSSLSSDFYNQLIKALLFAFLLMALVVYFVFGESKMIKVYSLMLTLISARLTFPASSFIGGFAIVLGLVAFIYSIYISKSKKDYLYSLIILVAIVLSFIFPFYLAMIPLVGLLIVIYTYASVPSIAVVFAAFADIIMTVALVDFFGMKISSAGIVAFLMLIGYSVDTDILLTTRVLRRKSESINQAIFGAFKTGIMMTLTAIAAVSIGLIIVYHFQSILNQIFTIMIIGLTFDIFNTWITNACMIKWYAERRNR